MGISERKERERTERKALIKGCAKDLILERGAEEVSMSDIAKKAELSKATLYIYFHNKDELFQEICEEAAIAFLDYYRSRLKEGSSALDSLILYWKSYVDFFGKSLDMIILFNMKHYLTPGYPFISKQDVNKPGGGPAYVFFDMLRQMVIRGIAEGIFEPDVNPTLIAHTILSLFSLIVENAASVSGGEKRLDQDMIGDMRGIFQIMLRGITREGVDRSLLVLET
jgi:AcrR family transcriptional regulator